MAVMSKHVPLSNDRCITLEAFSQPSYSRTTVWPFDLVSEISNYWPGMSYEFIFQYADMMDV